MGIIDEIDEYPRDGRFYLLEEITSSAGFFVFNGLPVYGVFSHKRKRATPVRTALLELDTGIDLLPIREGEETSVKTFDLIRMTAIPDEREVDAFLTLCRDHARGGSGLTLRDFFFAASRLFRRDGEHGKKRAVGLYGELSVIELASRYGVDLSESWQKTGINSKYDFSLDHMNIEVKTTTRREMIAMIKHTQLFNEDRNVLGFCRIEKSPSGITLSTLAQRLMDEGSCFTTLESRLALAEELLAIEYRDLETPYKLVDLTFYDCERINPFLELPDRITSLTYEYVLASLPTVRFSDILER